MIIKTKVDLTEEIKSKIKELYIQGLTIDEIIDTDVIFNCRTTIHIGH
jgi:hypothetical protein